VPCRENKDESEAGGTRLCDILVEDIEDILQTTEKRKMGVGRENGGHSHSHKVLRM